jgi:cell division septal protein FtsQ
MATSRSRRRRKQWNGVIPRAARAVWAVVTWIARHPQPLVLAGVLGVSAWALHTHARRAAAFRITNVILPADASFTLPKPLIGESLWDVDLRALSAELQKQEPALKSVRVTRQLPNTVRISAIPRMPIAQVRLDRWYPVDRDGFILPEPSQEAYPRLVQLTGLDRTALKPGRAYEDGQLPLALRVAEKMRRAPALVSRKVVEINVADPEQIWFVLDSEMEVRCGSEAELEAHLNRLKHAFRALAKRRELEVRYIDVRFDEPVVGPLSVTGA